jgi:hypothetical protein
MSIHESADETHLRRAKEALTAYQAREAEARKALTEAVESTRLARDKYNALFAATEQREYERRRVTYDHCTK